MFADEKALFTHRAFFSGSTFLANIFISFSPGRLGNSIPVRDGLFVH